MRFEHWCALAGVSACVHPLVGLGGGWGQNVTKHYVTYNGNKTPIQEKEKKGKEKEKKEYAIDDDSDTDSDNEMLMKSETN